MSQLIKITTIPIKIAVNVEKGRFEKVEQPFPDHQRAQRVQQVQQEQIETQQQTYSPKAMQVKKDSYVPTSTIQATIPLEFATIDNVLNMRVGNGEGKFSDAIAIPAAKVKQERVTSQNSTQMAYVPSPSNEIKWQPSALDLQIDMNINDPTMKYIPGSISFEVEQYPSVQIEYLGGPQYVPPSSDPNYKGNK